MKEQTNSHKESPWIILGLCAVVASSIWVEVCLTKFVSFKVYHHYVYAIISTVILSSGFAGLSVHLFPKAIGSLNRDPWGICAKASLAYSITLLLVTVIFCWLPVDPLYPYYFPLGVFLYFFLFSIPCFLAGLVIGNTLSTTTRPVTVIYFFDLLAAAAGALVCPLTLEWLGGYGTIVAAAGLGAFAFLAFGKAANNKSNVLVGLGIFVVAAAAFLAYPQWAMQKFGSDIWTKKEVSYQPLIDNTFHGIARTYWSPIARIDITKTGWTNQIDYCPGDPPDPFSLEARVIMVDASAPTRQVHIHGDLLKDPHLPNFLWATPYVVHPAVKQALVIGAGGGIDLLIAKRFQVGRVDGIEVNPATYKHCLLGQGDPEANLYQPGLSSTAETQVGIHNAEARHYCSTLPAESLDTIHATGVDTITAAMSGALTMVENYLYTLDAVSDYMRVLKKDGVLSLTHWREPRFTSQRMLVTYIDYLNSIGITDPWRYIVVVGNHRWTDALMKKTPFTESDVNNLREWAKKNNFVLMVDPFRSEYAFAGMNKDEDIYGKLVHSSKQERQKIISALDYDIEPMTDDRPFFYKQQKVETLLVTFRGSSMPFIFLLIMVTVCFPIFLLPLNKVRKEKTSVLVPSPQLLYALCFAVGGFAFLLYEIAIMQLFSVFVGGPMYSLCVTLVSVMVGYAFGSLVSPKLGHSRNGFLTVGVALAAVFTLLYFQLPALIHMMMPMSEVARIAISAAIVAGVSFLAGLTPALALENVKRTYGDGVSWMWGISCACNALGAMSFPFLAQATGVSGTLAIVAVLYLCSNFGFAFLSKPGTVSSA